jgi:hypothetical protein
MAAPMAAGAAAVVRQYLRTDLGITEPSGALLKAVLVAGTVRLPSRRPAGSKTDVGYPDYDQGFGRLNLGNLLPHAGALPNRRLLCVDVANDAPNALEYGAPLDSPRRAIHQYVMSIAADTQEPLRIVLAWTDPPGSGVQNALGLRLVPPGGVRIAGNQEFKSPGASDFSNPDPYGIYWDKLNCVERIVVDSPLAGDYTLHVVALNTPLPPQGYALAVNGNIADWRPV